MGSGKRGISIGVGAVAIGKGIRELDDLGLHELLSSTDKLVVAEFHMEGCPSCRTMAPVLDSLAREMEDVIFVRVDARRNMDVALRYGVVATPTFLLFCRETYLTEMVGVIHPEEFRSVLNDMLKHRSECAGGAMMPPSETDGKR
jgi:thioredoxin 1